MIVAPSLPRAQIRAGAEEAAHAFSFVKGDTMQGVLLHLWIRHAPDRTLPVSGVQTTVRISEE
jgi:hypothetical protein